MNIKPFVVFLGITACTLAFPHTEAHVLDDALEQAGHYYKIYDFQMKWDEAKVFCESMGGHLVTIENSEENIILKQVLAKGANNLYFIGLGQQ